MRTVLSFLILFASLNNFSFANTANEDLRIGTISGKVLDKTLKQPIPYANVVLKNAADGSTVTGAITDDNGNFEIEKIKAGKYTFVVQYIGYKPYSKTLEISKKNRKHNLGTIYLEEEAQALDGVEVVAERSTIEQKVDRKVINVGKDLVTSGPTASDIMNNLPSVNVDQQTGAISMRGNANVRVMIDGKMSNIPAADLLKQIPSSSIKSIELITNPSAKYNPEGMSGIINIVLHKNAMVGFNGSLNMSLAYQDRAKFNSALNLNYRTGKFNIYGNYGNNISKNENGGEVTSSYPNPDENRDQIFRFLDNRKNHLFKVGLDVYLNDKNTLSVFTNQRLNDGKFRGGTDIVYPNQAPLNQRHNFRNLSDNAASQYNFNYKREFDKEGHNIELEADYNYFDSDDFTFQRFSGNNAQPNFDEDIFKTRKRFTGNLDYVNPLGKSMKLELGAEVRLFNSLEDYSSTGTSIDPVEGSIPTPSTNFDYTRNIYSAYATFSKKWDKWTAQAGIRAEQVNVEAEALQSRRDNETETLIPFENDYFQVYPSAFITYTPSEKNNYQFSYSRRVDRPGLGQVNPIREWSTPLISQVGNLNLQPQFTNSLELNYTRNFKGGSLTSGVFYRLINDEINQVLFVDRTDFRKNIISNDNFNDTNAYGIELSGRYRPTNWWSINASFDLYTQTQTGIVEALTLSPDVATEADIELRKTEVENTTYNFRMFNNFKLTKKLSLSAFGMYRGPSETLQFNPKEMYFVNLGARYSFAKGKGTIAFNFNDVFDTMKFGFDTELPSPAVGEFRWESRTITANLSYRFGSGKYRAKSRKQRDKNEKQGGGLF
ncbi:MAG: TonB-dependent receptor [Flavobacteriaceae bacterium]|nr:TonB-dependent receptor [Flavobacteriaceae bacterium]